MQRSTRTLALTLAIAPAALFAAQTASAANITLYDGATDPGIFTTDPAGFTFDDFTNAVVDTGSSITIDANTDQNGNSGIFGGVGRDIVGDPLPDFDAAEHNVRVEFRYTAQTRANFTINLQDQDSPTSAQQYQYFFDTANAVDLGDGFLGQEVALTSPIFDQAAFGFSAGDGVINFGLTQWQLQSPFGGDIPLNIEVRSIAIVPVPEPGALGLVGLGGLALLGRRNGNSAR